MVKIPIKLVTWSEVESWSRDLARKIIDSGYQPDVIIAIARGGVVTARILCDYLGVLDLLSIKIEHWIETAAHTENATVKYSFNTDLSSKRVLLVDDICDTGKSIVVAKEHITEKSRPLEIKTATMQYISSVAKYKPDYYVDDVKDWIWYLYPWNYMEDSINLVKKILQSDPFRKWSVDEISKGFKEAYGIDPPIELNQVIEEGIRRGIFYHENGEVKIKKQYTI
ncbi:phosphoribosyltransferase [Fervidicoccus fontis]|uniref:Phosphoribosyltransferase n=1 Tax=Fervidicoccus fontis TaxID=683846 RepID=A0A2J6N1Z1_9CREN|nr:phosphoribosyltransferase [Fervidicoccus fontis]PMB75364.1 MAG: phosphoribosyltransferase [Fervidicoccus fontis]PMB75496.1 MAG: phosphoribosyltransferase [Fervidicoccus fontis]PMB76256.1 MAG: phosphoribosyltransferase [Fervidicoccus fontis]PMB78051.1 MAG: phosphoribosyltransferase [Fervidicoccus fontis]HEW64227.1 phosphoribosyltransferase [Fervidicoccus fontis]